MNCQREYTWSIIKDGIPSRYTMAILAFFGCVFNYMLRINISIAIVAMVSHEPSSGDVLETESHLGECAPPNNTNLSTHEKDEDGEFHWDEKMQSIIIGSFFWGYMLTQVPGGRLAEIFGAKRIFGGALLASGIINILYPLVAAANPIALIALRCLLGVFQGVTYPAMHTLLAQWSPPLERSRMTSIVYSGAQAGTIIGLPLAGFIISCLGWRWVFYLMGGGSLVWTALWFTIVHDSPGVHPSISPKERDYIESSLSEELTSSPGEVKTIKSVPWKEIWTSRPFWAIIVAGVASGWGFWTLLIQLPTYMKTILHFDIKKNSFFSALPYLVMWIFGLCFSTGADSLRRLQILTVTQVRKLSTICCLVLPAICLLGVTFVGCDPTLTIILLTMGVGLAGAKYSSYLTNHIDIAPNYAGTLMGIANTFTTLPGWLAPLTAGVLTNGAQTLGQWNKVWYITGAVYVGGCIFYLVFGSGNVQPWNFGPTNLEKEEEEVPKAIEPVLCLYNAEEPSKDLEDSKDTGIKCC